MGPRVIILVSAMLLLSTSSAHNITRILEQYPDFVQFNALLTQTHLAEVINSRRTITVLALTNDHLGELSGKPDDVVKRILSTHIVLDYFDVLKLNKLKGNHNILTNLYQSTGTADDQQGFLNVVHNPNGIFFGSAMKGAPVDAKLEGSVASQPYNISVLSISHVIVAPGIDGSLAPVQAPPPKAATAAAPEADPPAESPEDDLPAEEPSADAEAPAPSDAPAAAAPGPDAAPADVDDAQPAPSENAAGRAVVSGVSVGMAAALVSLWI
ncbi:Fasciclin-like arabinogalactan protein 3 [Striga hermonthica]|uniref:Fasciclin-like arabinogalactan protein 3 n=1 Tax=Striga hermonthica TaxID=68872 RepID=A0A9N7MTU9_STRHE|nr:Fasciclin-like arabinogalactan protein 3 [Striga hermonthica]